MKRKRTTKHRTLLNLTAQPHIFIAGTISTEETTSDWDDSTTSAIEETTNGNETTAAIEYQSKQEEANNDDTLDCSMGERPRYTNGNKLSPWKVVARHTGTRRTHYHIIYIHRKKLGAQLKAWQNYTIQITQVFSNCMYSVPFGVHYFRL